MQKNKERAFIVMWCCDGLEWVEDITNKDAQAMWSTLKGEEAKTLSPALRMAVLRAKYNPQRFYEIYSITAVDGIKKSDIIEMFNNSPQTAAEIIREKGYKIYSDRANTEKVIS